MERLNSFTCNYIHCFNLNDYTFSIEGKLLFKQQQRAVKLLDLFFCSKHFRLLAPVVLKASNKVLAICHFKMT